MKSKCIICGSELSSILFSAENMPQGAQVMPTAEEIEAGEDTGLSLSLRRCPRCGLVQFDCEPVDYYRKAIRAVGLSSTMRELRRRDYAYLIKKYGLSGKKWIECGCGNGDFLEVLREFPVQIYGTEADPENVKTARRKLGRSSLSYAWSPEDPGRSQTVFSYLESGVHEKEESPKPAQVPADHIMEFFPENGDQEIPGAPFDVFLSFNFLEHQPDPVSMLRCLHKNLTKGGIGLITVPSFEYILKEGRYYELVRDHIANYDEDALKALCEYCGFEVKDSKSIGIGDTLRVVVKKKSEADWDHELENDSLADEDSEDIEEYSVLEKNYQMLSAKIREYMNELHASGRTIAMWGASHQGFTIAATTALKDEVKYIIDSAPFKQGRFAPASHLPIVAPDYYKEHPVDVILIAAPGYIREIEASIRKMYEDCPAGIPRICDILELKER